jgi:restriction system protein
MGAFLGFWPTSIVALGLVYGAKPPVNERRKRFEEYINQKSAYEYWQRKKHRDHWQRLSGHAFEKALGKVFQQSGYEAEVTKGSGDEGIDLILTDKNGRIAVQAKNHAKPVAPAVARDLFGAMQHGNFDRGMIVSSGGFTKNVYEFVSGKKIELVGLQEVIKMVNSLE